MTNRFDRALKQQILKFAAAGLFLAVKTTVVIGAECPGNPDAIGTSRVLTVSPHEFNHIGSMQYAQSLPLEDHEVVLTFDDGPSPLFTDVILNV